MVINYKNTAEGVRENQDKFRKLWNEGRIFQFGRKALRAYQEECIAGWDNNQAQIVILLEEIVEAICHRFNYKMITSRHQEAPQSAVQGSGTVELRTKLNPEEIVPISEGVIVRILYNIIKNTIKAFETQPKAVKQEKEKLHIEIELIYLKGNIILTVKDNGQGFDLNVPLPAIRQLLIEDPDTLGVISRELSPHAANILEEYIVDNKPFAIYPLTLEELFMLFLHRKLSGSLVNTQAGDVTSGIGLSSVRAMLRGSYGGDIFISNHPAGGAYTLICIPIQPGAVDARHLIGEL